MIDTSNFPIAYSPLPIIKTWIDESVGLKRKKIICYVTEKCYLISEIKRYGYVTLSENDGKIYNDDCALKEYEVVFDRRIDSKDNIQNQEPDIFNGHVNNSNIVNFLSNSKEMCDEMVEYLNEKLLSEELKNNPYENEDDIKEKFQEYVNSYKVRLSLASEVKQK